MRYNSHPLHFTCLIFCLARVVVSSRKRKSTAFTLRDTHNNVEAVQPRSHSSAMALVLPRNHVNVPLTKHSIPYMLQKWMGEGEYGKIVELCGKKNGKFWKYVWPLITTYEHYETLFEHLKQHKMLPSFFAHGNMTLVQRAMAEGDDSSKLQIEQNFTLDAICMCIKEDKYERAIDLMRAEQEIHENDDDFDEFMYDLLSKFTPGSNRASLKRFLTLYGGQFSESYPDIFEVFCGKLAFASKEWYSDPSTKKPLVDLIGQPSILAPTALATELLMEDGHQIEFIEYGWNETIAEGLRGNYRNGGRRLWRTMVKEYPDRFSGAFPSSENALAAVLEKFPTKQELEETWAKKNASNLQVKLEMLVPNLLPTVLLRIVSEYAVTWIAFLWSPPQSQSISPVNGEQIHGQLKILMNKRRYGEVIELGNKMEKDELAKYLYPLMTDIEHCKYLNGYLDCRNMLPSFLVQGSMELVRRAVLEFRNMDFDYYIFHGHICDAIILSIKNDQHDRAINLLRVERERYATTDEQRRLTGKMPEFDMLLRDFSEKLVMEDDSAPLKRFITLRKEGTQRRASEYFRGYVSRNGASLKIYPGNPYYKRLLTDFVGQSSLITTTAFAHGFLWSITIITCLILSSMVGEKPSRKA